MNEVPSLTSNPPEWDQFPCPYCGGKVEWVSNAKVYGKKYGNGMCFLCEGCGARVGAHGEFHAHKKRPLGMLATEDMRQLKMECHKRFDYPWHTHQIKRGQCYVRLAKLMEIDPKRCHFGWFNKTDLLKAKQILSHRNWWEWKRDDDENS